MNTWVKTSHTHAWLRMELRTKIIRNTAEAHKESTPAGKLFHGKHAERRVQKLRDYNVDLFGKGPAQHLASRKAMDCQMVKDLLIALLLGKERNI